MAQNLNKLRQLRLTEEQVLELHELEKKYTARAGRPVPGGAAMFVTPYLQQLWLGGIAESALEVPAFDELRKRTHRTRRQRVRTWSTQMRRSATADDIIQELTRLVAVPTFLTVVIRRDMRGLLP